MEAYHFEAASKDSQLPEPDVERRAREGPIGLFHDHHVNGSREGGCVDLIVKLPEVGKHLAQIVHGIHGCRFLFHACH